MARYQVTQLPDGTRWVILDRHLYGYCTMPDGKGNHLPLEWRGRAAAEAWLQICRQAWSNGLVPAPKNWQADHPADDSPWTETQVGDDVPTWGEIATLWDYSWYNG